MAVSKFEIYEYWKDKAITKDFEVKHIQDCTPEDAWIRITEEFPDEVVCWGCGMPPYHMGQHRTIRAIWNQDRLLQKAHIRPKSQKGGDQPENLFLLCPQCHAESPDTVSPRNFYAWVYYKRKHDHWVQVLQRDLELAARILNVDLADVAERMVRLPTEAEIQYLRTEMLRRCGLHGTFMAPMTRAMAYLEWLTDDESQRMFLKWKEEHSEKEALDERDVRRPCDRNFGV